MLWICIC